MDMLSRCFTASLLLVAIASTAFAQQPASRESLLTGRTASQPVLDAIEVYLDRKEKKIVGGRPAKAGQFPWQVALLVVRVPDAYDAHFCGGSVHTERWIVTAAHCVHDTEAADIAIVAGTHRLNAEAPERIAVSRILVHEDYDDETYDNDIALLELEKPLALGDRIRVIPLLGTGDEPTTLKPGALLTVSGWGRTQQDGEGTSALQYVDIPFVERKTCNRALAYDGAVTERMICAGVAAGGKDSCQGDSGGPLAANTGSQPRLAGVVSWGEGCAQANKVGVYTRVSQFTGWVSTCTTDTARCKAKHR